MSVSGSTGRRNGNRFTPKVIVPQKTFGPLTWWAVAVAITLLSASSVFADDVTDFYKGKSIRLLIGEPSAADMMADVYRGKSVTFLADVKEGSPYDLTARNAGAVLGKYIPGHPVIVMENMPGAANGRATEYLYNEAPRDGTVLLVASPYIVLAQLLTPSVKYRAEEFGWLGRIAPLTQVGFVSRNKGIVSVEDAKARDVILGATAPVTPGAMVPWALNRLIGTRFKVVRGYVGDTDLFIAVQRGEIDGMGNIGLHALNQRGWIAQRQIDVLYSISNTRLAALPNVPTVAALAKSDHALAVLRLLASISDIGITIVMPPEVPEARVADLRRALTKTIEDTAFVESERRIGVEVAPLSGDEAYDMVHRVTGAPKNIVEAMKSAIEPMN